MIRSRITSTSALVGTGCITNARPPPSAPNRVQRLLADARCAQIARCAVEHHAAGCDAVLACTKRPAR